MSAQTAKLATQRTAHTADLTPSVLAEIRELLDAAFDGDFGDDDWDHTLGGMHVMLMSAGRILGHVAVVQRRLLWADRPLRTAYVEGLAVRADQRRKGHAAALMTEAERLIRRGYDLGALSDGTEVDGFYGRRGWEVWTGPTGVLSPDGPRWTPEEDGGVLILRTPSTPDITLADPLLCDWRAGDVW